jgi:hypothetical protein
VIQIRNTRHGNAFVNRDIGRNRTHLLKTFFGHFCMWLYNYSRWPVSMLMRQGSTQRDSWHCRLKGQSDSWLHSGRQLVVGSPEPVVLIKWKKYVLLKVQTLTHRCKPLNLSLNFKKSRRGVISKFERWLTNLVFIICLLINLSNFLENQGST